MDHPSYGSQDETALRESVRARLADGRLFRVHTLSIFRQGTGRPCNVCGRAIGRDQNEHEVPHRDDSFGLAHETCYRIWREESRR